MTDPLGGLSEEPPRPEPQEQQPARRRPFLPTTWLLLAVIAAGFVAEGLIGKDGSVQDTAALVRLGALYLPAIRAGDWWRIGSYAFLHIGWAHIAMNAWALWILAPQLEQTYGSNLTLGFFAATALAGGGASTLWAMVREGNPALAAGASGGLFGLFGATAALAFRLRHRIPPPARKSIYRRIGSTLLINLAIAFFFPVDSAAHVGGLISGALLGLVAPLKTMPERPWHRPASWLIIGSALVLAGMEGAAVAWAVHPKPRTLRGPGVTAQVSGMLTPLEPGVAVLPGAAYMDIRREDQPLALEPGEDAVRIGDRTWVREKDSKDNTEVTLLAAADGAGRLIIEFGCGADFCRGPAGEKMLEDAARTIRVVP